jgi:hypothetical protein
MFREVYLLCVVGLSYIVIIDHSMHCFALILMGPIKVYPKFNIIPCQPGFIFLLGSYT